MISRREFYWEEKIYDMASDIMNELLEKENSKYEDETVEWYLNGRTFEMQPYDSYVDAFSAMCDISEKRAYYDGEICVLGYDKDGNCVCREYRI